jgi:hypothetical protein
MEEKENNESVIMENNSIEIESHKNIMRKHSMRITMITKKLLGRYIVMHKIISFIGVLTHFAVLIASAL